MFIKNIFLLYFYDNYNLRLLFIIEVYTWSKKMKKIKFVSATQRRQIRRMIRENFREKRLLEEKRELALQEFKIAHERKLQETGNIGEANLLLLEVDIMSALGFGSISGLKQQFVTSVMKDMGMSTDTLAGKFMVNMIENIGMKQLFALIGSGDSCDAVVELLSKAAMETITEYGAAKLIAYVFEKTAGKTSTVASAEIADAMNTFVAAIGIEVANDLIYQYFKVAMLDDLSDKICQGGIMGILGNAKNMISGGGDAESEMLDSLTGGSKEGGGVDMAGIASLVSKAIK